MKILEKLKEIRFSDPITQSQHILNIADKLNELIDALNELEERIEKIIRPAGIVPYDIANQSAPEQEDKAFLPLLKYNAAKFFNIDKYTNKTSKGYECKLCANPVFISIDEMPMYQHLNDAHPFGESDSKNCICGIITDNAHRYDCPSFKEIDSQHTDDSDKIELKISNDIIRKYCVFIDCKYTKEQAEKIKKYIEEAIRYYEEHKND